MSQVLLDSWVTDMKTIREIDKKNNENRMSDSLIKKNTKHYGNKQAGKLSNTR